MIARLRGLDRTALALAGALFAVHAALFAWIQGADMASDFALHAVVVRVGMDTGTFPGNPLFYVTAALAAGLRRGDVAIEGAIAAVLGLAVAAKFLVSWLVARRETQVRPAALAVAVALLSFAFSLPTSKVYLGQLPPNVFHNSTTIFLMPFAVALFWCCAQFLRTGEARWLRSIGALAVVNVLAKPSFVFPVLVVFPALALLRFGSGRRAWGAIAVSAFMGALVLVQYVYVYETGSTETIYRSGGFGVSGEGGVTIDPFHVWSHFSPNIPLSIAASLGFPLVAAAVYRRRLFDSDLVRFAAALVAVSYAIFAIVAETGVREFHGNFAWQGIVSGYMLFLAVLLRVWSLWDLRRMRAGSLAVAGAFLAHVGAGVAFLTYYVTQETFF